MCSVWLLVAVVVVGGARGAVSQCWEHPSCQEVKSESSLMECIQLCHADLTASIIPGHAPLLPPSLSDSSPFALTPSSPQTKRSYSMEHFRWGKPVGRKRRPIKVYTSDGVEEESDEVFPALMRRELANELLAAAAKKEEQEEAVVEGTEAEQQREEEEEEEQRLRLLDRVKDDKDALYKMRHFRWGGPAASKRYGGFMKSWDEKSHRPLLTVFKNVINKDGQQQ